MIRDRIMGDGEGPQQAVQADEDGIEDKNDLPSLICLPVSYAPGGTTGTEHELTAEGKGHMASEYLKWKYRDVKPDQTVELTPRQKRATGGITINGMYFWAQDCLLHPFIW